MHLIFPKRHQKKDETARTLKKLQRQDTARSSHQLDSIANSSANQIDDSTHHPALSTDTSGSTHLLEPSDTNVCHSNIDKEGFKAMLDCHDKLVTAIATDYLTIVGALLSHRFVSEEVYAKMLATTFFNS